MTPAQRRMRASAAALTRWAKTDDRQAATKPARVGYMARWEREVDPDGVLPIDERAKRASLALKAHMTGLALRSSKSRSAAQR